MSDGESDRGLGLVDGDCEELGEAEIKLRLPLRADDLPPQPRSRARGTMPPPLPRAHARGTMPAPLPRAGARGTEPPPIPVRAVAAPPPLPAPPRVMPLPPPIPARALQQRPLSPIGSAVFEPDFDDVATSPTSGLGLDAGARDRQDDTVRQSLVERDRLLSESWFAGEAEAEARVDYAPRRRRLLVLVVAAILVVATGVLLIVVVDKATATRITGRAGEVASIAPEPDFAPPVESESGAVIEPMVESMNEPMVEPIVEPVVEVEVVVPSTTAPAAPVTEVAARPSHSASAPKPEASVGERRASKRTKRAKKRRGGAKNPPVSDDATAGTLMLGAKPPCNIYIDGRNTGKMTPQRDLRLASGKHKVTLRNRRYRIKKTFTVTIAPGRTLRVIKDMSDRIGQ